MNAETDEGPKGSIRSSLFWTSFGQAAFFVLQFGSTVLLARLLSPREQGVFAIGVATVALITTVQSLGLNNYLIRAERIDRPMLASVFTINLILSVLLSVGIIALGMFSTHMFRDPGTNRVMLWMSLTPLIGAVGIVPTSLLQRNGDFRALSLLKIFSTLIGTALTVVLAFLHYSYMSLAYGWVLTCAINAFGACAFAPHYTHWRLGLSDWRTIARFGIGMLMVNGSTQAQKQMLNLSMGRFQGLAATGLYSRANNLFSLLLENTLTVAMRVFLVDFAEAARRGQDLRERYRRVIDLMTVLLWPLFAGLGVLSGPCIQLLYGPKWADLSLALSLLCVSGLFSISVAMAWELFVVANETDRQARLEINRTIVGTIMFVIGCQWDLNAAAATRVLEAIYVVMLYRPHIKRITGSSDHDLTPIFLRNGALTVVAIAPAAGLMMIYGWNPRTPLPLVFGSVALGCLLWAAALVVTRHPIGVEIARFHRKMTGASRRPEAGLDQ